MISRPERLLPIACVAAAICLFASELMVTFEFTPPGGEALAEQKAGERHGNAMFVIAVFAIAATVGAVALASRPQALAAAAMGVVALLIFLLNDLPDAGQIGTLDDARQSFFDAEAIPQPGFWLEMVGALGLAVSGVALATLNQSQLAALRPRRFARAEPGSTGEQLDVEAGAAPSTNASGPAHSAASNSAHDAHPLASGPAVRLAERLGIDLATVRGTGPDGRIVRSDVEAARDGDSDTPSRSRER